MNKTFNICPNCKENNKPSAKFCAYCGGKIKKDAPIEDQQPKTEGNVENQSTSDGKRWFVRTDGYTLDMPLDEGYRWVAWNWMYGRSETPYGNYRVEFWYEGEVIATETVYIHP